MKILIFLLTFFFSYQCFAQTDQKCESKIDSLTKTLVYSKVDEMPDVVGGKMLLAKELLSNLKVTKTEHANGKITIAFIVNIDGTLTGKRIIKAPTSGNLATQALKLVDNFKWESGKCNGKKVPVIYVLPIIIETHETP